MSRVLVISTSLRAISNSDLLTEYLIKGAKDAGHDVEHISLKGKKLTDRTQTVSLERRFKKAQSSIDHDCHPSDSYRLQVRSLFLFQITP